MFHRIQHIYVPNSLNTVRVVLERIGPLWVVLTADDCLGNRFEVVLQCKTADQAKQVDIFPYLKIRCLCVKLVL